MTKLKPKIIAIANQKGGVGKTTTAFNLGVALAKQYDFVIYDFGTLENMNTSQFLEKDIKIVVAGTKPYELETLSTVFESFDNDKINYIFSFSHINERVIIKERMGEKQDCTFFAEYCPSLFDYNPNHESDF